MTSVAKVSVCIPAYRQTRYLKKALDTLFSQRCSDYEVIVTDDSPDDEVAQLVHQYRADGRVHYYRNRQRLGSPANWNAAVARARGEYIKILHHDDWFPDGDALGRFVELLDEHPDAGFAFSASLIYARSGAILRTHRPEPEQLAALSRCPEALVTANVIGAPSATIYRRSNAIAYDTQLKWLVDVDFYIRTLRQNGSYAFSPRALICTPTGIEHQVTEECYANREVELTENMLLLHKHYEHAKNVPELARFWRYLLARHRIWTLDKLQSVAPCPEPLRDFFAEVFRLPIWLSVARDIAHRAVYRTYLALPEPAKQLWRFFKRSARAARWVRS